MKNFSISTGLFCVVALAMAGCTARAPLSAAPASKESAPTIEAPRAESTGLELAIQDVSIEPKAPIEGVVDFRFYVTLGVEKTAAKYDFIANLKAEADSTLAQATFEVKQCATIDCSKVLPADDVAAAPFTAEVTCQDEDCASAIIELKGRADSAYAGLTATLTKEVLTGLEVSQVKSNEGADDNLVAATEALKDEANFDKTGRIEVVTVSNSSLRKLKVYVDLLPANIAVDSITQRQIGVISQSDVDGKKRRQFYDWTVGSQLDEFATTSVRDMRAFTLDHNPEAATLVIRIPGQAQGDLEFTLSGEELGVYFVDLRQ